jgi:hypothetical protein
MTVDADSDFGVLGFEVDGGVGPRRMFSLS